MRFLLPVLLVFVGVGAGTSAGCSPAARLKVEARRDTRTLGEAANAYWLAVRWNDVGTASAYLATPEEKLRLGKIVGQPRVRITDVSVVQIVIGEPLPAARLPVTRDGVAVVRIDSYDELSGRADVRSVEQHWVCTGRDWTVDAERSPLGADRPW
jgi:hypothetical protein